MALPKIKHPIFETKIPSTGAKLLYRQMLVQDEKILLTAKASEEASDIFRAVKQVVNNCILDDLDIDSLATFDIEYLFIKFRAVSIGNVIDVTYKDKGDDGEYKFHIDLDEVEVQFPENIDKLIKINDDAGVLMKYPPASLFDSENSLMTGKDGYEYLAASCIDTIFDGDDVYPAAESTIEERVEYIQSLTAKTYADVKKFLNEMPRLQYHIEYENSLGVARKLELNTLTDFFTFW
jgi:hypothetical protein